MNLSNTTAAISLRLPPYNRVRITLVGCGGTGSHLASGLAAVAIGFQERAVPCEMRFIDPDRVEEKNVGRQLFAGDDVRLPKAGVLAQRINAAYGLAIAHALRKVTPDDLLPERDALNIVVGAVDNAAARADISRAVIAAAGGLWWLDCGNENHSGQIAIGNEHRARHLRAAIALSMTDRLPAPHVVYPDLIATSKQLKRRGASCAELTESGEQGLMLNRLMAAWALTMLHEFLSGTLRYFALDVDTKWGGVRAHIIDEQTLAEVLK